MKENVISESSIQVCQCYDPSSIKSETELDNSQGPFFHQYSLFPILERRVGQTRDSPVVIH